MAAAIGLREDFDAKALRALAKRAKEGRRRVACWRWQAIYDGATRGEAAKINGVTLSRSSATGFCASTRWRLKV